MFNEGRLVTLTATPGADHRFANWSGSCSGTAMTVDVTIDADKSCNARFTQDPTGPYQEIYANPNPVGAHTGGPARIDVNYDVSDGDATLTGVAARVHFNSSMLTFDQVGATLTTVDFSGAWPGSLPQFLASVHFTTAGGFTGSTQVNFSASDLAAGYTLAATPATVFEQPCTLDTDGNGSDGALTDGVLDVRYLFGFSGAQLTDGAIGPGAARPDAASIIAYLDGCPAMLDVDGNGSAGALTDGVLIVRYLFGFTGAQLTDGAVGPGCTRCDAASIIAFLNTYRPTSTAVSQALASEGTASVGEQLVSSRVNSVSAGRNGKTINIQVDYMTTKVAHTGLGLRMHFDSSKLSFASLGDIYPPGAPQYQVQEDRLDFDGDPKTDRYINIAWVDYLGNWPGTDQTQLFTATFQTVKGKGSGATTIRYTTADVAAGMSAYLEPVDIGPGKGANSR
jgi:hypothetical protein